MLGHYCVDSHEITPPQQYVSLGERVVTILEAQPSGAERVSASGRSDRYLKKLLTERRRKEGRGHVLYERVPATAAVYEITP